MKGDAFGLVVSLIDLQAMPRNGVLPQHSIFQYIVIPSSRYGATKCQSSTLELLHEGQA